MTTPEASKALKIGDSVVRRPGTLGNMDGDAAPGHIVDIFYRGAHQMATVRFPTREETFITDIYVRANP